MNKLEKKTIQKYVDELSSTAPTPGGGAVAALAGVQAASLVEKVALLTINKKKYLKVGKKMRVISRKAKTLKDRLLVLFSKDVEAFEGVMEAYRTGIGKEKALKTATKIPLETAVLSNEVRGLAKVAMDKGNQNAFSDAKTAYLLAEAAKLSALENVKINLKSIKETSFVNKVQQQIAALGN